MTSKKGEKEEQRKFSFEDTSPSPRTAVVAAEAQNVVGPRRGWCHVQAKRVFQGQFRVALAFDCHVRGFTRGLEDRGGWRGCHLGFWGPLPRIRDCQRSSKVSDEKFCTVLSDE
ncbi:hypothetical protein RUM44_000420 [Polyplax serrata]|uniref:Uncharacterized protein n=1 Tax=Polyplax serrata TaxID=468196 RepID=A0ABR1B5D8_POLSC